MILIAGTEFREPEFGDVWNFVSTVLERQNIYEQQTQRSNDTELHWLELNLLITGLTLTQKNALESIYTTNLGCMVEIQFQGQVFDALIKPPLKVVTERDLCSYSVELNLETETLSWTSS